MRKIAKGAAPPSLTAWKVANPDGRYDPDLQNPEKQAVRDALFREHTGCVLIAVRRCSRPRSPCISITLSLGAGPRIVTWTMTTWPGHVPSGVVVTTRRVIDFCRLRPT